MKSFFNFSYDNKDFAIFQYAFSMIMEYFSESFGLETNIFHYRMVARLRILRDSDVESLTEFIKSLSIPNELFLTRCLKILSKYIIFDLCKWVSVLNGLIDFAQLYLKLRKKLIG